MALEIVGNWLTGGTAPIARILQAFLTDKGNNLRLVGSQPRDPKGVDPEVPRAAGEAMGGEATLVASIMQDG